MSHSDEIVFTIFLIFTGAAVMATVALYARQALLIGYILLGILIGPAGFALIENAEFVEQISHIGIMFLLFLLGLNLDPKKLMHMFRDSLLITLVSSLLFFILGYLVGWWLGYTLLEKLVLGGCVIFSSTIIGLKLLPTTVLHHRRTGEIIISILLLQDLIAIFLLLLVQTKADSDAPLGEIIQLLVSLPTIVIFCLAFERWVLSPLFRRFDKIQEYLFLCAIGWCLGVAQLAEWAGLSHEIGAFIAGVSIATGPLSLFIAEFLKPLRDFFLVIFFFALGAQFDLAIMSSVLVPALILAGIALVLKPFIFSLLFRYVGEKKPVAWEIGFRIGQLSEFSILLAMLALNVDAVRSEAAYLIHVATIITFLVSSYIIVFNFPSPIALSDRLRRD